MIYDWRKDHYPNITQCWDATTGEEIKFVFFLDTDSGQLGRYEADGNKTKAGPIIIWETRQVTFEAPVNRIRFREFL